MTSPRDKCQTHGSLTFYFALYQYLYSLYVDPNRCFFFLQHSGPAICPSNREGKKKKKPLRCLHHRWSTRSCCYLPDPHPHPSHPAASSYTSNWHNQEAKIVLLFKYDHTRMGIKTKINSESVLFSLLTVHLMNFGCFRVNTCFFS